MDFCIVAPRPDVDGWRHPKARATASPQPSARVRQLVRVTAWARHRVGAKNPAMPTDPARDVERTAEHPRPGRRILSWRRLLLCLAAGLVAAGAVGVLVSPELSMLVGWAVAATGVLGWVWRLSWYQDHKGTKRLAEEEGQSHVTDTVVLIAAVASLVAVVVALVRAGSQDAVTVAVVILSVIVVTLSWALVNTVFALKYARMYYDGEEGGIDFRQQDPPAYTDFAYLAFTVGMSFGVSETEPSCTPIRTVALRHALLAYLFGTVVIAVAINLVTNLGQS
jgi:uncharacterized membrane protein